MLSAVIFDMGDILYDASQWRRGMVARLQERGVVIDFPAFREQWEAKLVAVYQGQREYWDALQELLSELLAGAGQPAIAEMLDFARQLAKKVGQRREPFPGVVETLPTLHQRGLRLAVLSDTENGQPRLRAILAQLGIEQHFDAIVASCETGHCKPAKEAFAAAADAVETPVSRCAFVGHDLDELTGAMAAGMFTIAYNFEPGVPADAYISHFSELPAVIAAQTG